MSATGVQPATLDARFASLGRPWNPCSARHRQWGAEIATDAGLSRVPYRFATVRSESRPQHLNGSTRHTTLRHTTPRMANQAAGIAHGWFRLGSRLGRVVRAALRPVGGGSAGVPRGSGSAAPGEARQGGARAAAPGTQRGETDAGLQAGDAVLPARTRGALQEQFGVVRLNAETHMRRAPIGASRAHCAPIQGGNGSQGPIVGEGKRTIKTWARRASRGIAYRAVRSERMRTTGTGARRSASVVGIAGSGAARAVKQGSDLSLEIVGRGVQFSMLRCILRAFRPGHVAVFLAAPLRRIAILLGASLQ